MKHLTISGFGVFAGIKGNRLIVKDKDNIFETPLSRLRTIRIDKKGVALSSDLILECAARGIRIFFNDWRNVPVAVVQGTNQHATVSIRQAQFECISSERSKFIAREIICTKIKNQRAVLLYFGKYLKKVSPLFGEIINQSTEQLLNNVKILNLAELQNNEWRGFLFGIEGKSAEIYWDTLTKCNLFPASFIKR